LGVQLLGPIFNAGKLKRYAELKAEAFKNEIASIIKLYEALGGGWYVDIKDTKEIN